MDAKKDRYQPFLAAFILSKQKVILLLYLSRLKYHYPIIKQVKDMLRLLPRQTPRQGLTVGINPKHKKYFGVMEYVKVDYFVNQQVAGKRLDRVSFEREAEENEMLINTNTKFAIFEQGPEDEIDCEPAQLKPSDQLESVKLTLSLEGRSNGNERVEIKASQLEEKLKEASLVLNNQNYFNFDQNGLALEIQPAFEEKPYGSVVEKTIIYLKKAPHQRIDIIEDQPEEEGQIIRIDGLRMEGMSVGGLKEQLEVIDRRVFRTRQLKPALMRKMGLKHCKGMLLYGPPGTGKTLIAREISRMFRVEPKIVNGPELLSQMVGQSQQKIRNLFADAQRQQELRGLDSQLHCIIFDEIDALCKKRGTVSSSGVYDLIVNQLLTCIDGIKSLNNILVIGITNRKDLIDEAVLRPGRLEVHIEVNLPDEKGRQEVLEIHTEKMRSNKMLSPAIDMQKIAARTANYTGAEIEGIVKSAQSFAIEDWKRNPEEMIVDQCKVEQEHFMRAIEEVPPQFGKDNRILHNILPGQMKQIESYVKIEKEILHSIKSLGRGKHSFIIRGQKGVGKTVMAASCALQAGFTFTKMINADRFIGFSQQQTIGQIVQIFEDAEKCESSCIVLDDVLRLMDYVPLGSRFNERILNLILNCLKKNLGDPNKKQVIIATIGPEEDFEGLGLKQQFNYIFEIEGLTAEETARVLIDLGFGQNKSRGLGEVVKGTTLKRLMDTTQIEGSKNGVKWLKCWQDSSKEMK